MFTAPPRIATIRGVDVHVAPSWLLVAGGIVWVYRGSFVQDGRSAAAALAMGVITAVLFTLSVLVHELAHALEGDHRGAEVEGITLFMLGGATALRAADRRARDEFAIAAIGPWSNIVIAAALGLVATRAAAAGLDAVADVAALTAWLNVGLALFNLVPGSPLDGGRVLRAVIWMVTGNRHRATTIAASLGVLMSLGLIGLSVWLLATSAASIVPAVVAGLVGAYMLRAARIEMLRARLHRWLAARTPRALAPALPEVGADAPVEVREAALAEDVDGVLLRDGGVAVGVVRRGDAGTVRALDALPRVDADGTGDQLADLLDADNPLVLVEDGDDVWLSSLQRIQEAVTAGRRGTA